MRTEVPLPRGAVMIMVGGRTDGRWFNFPLSYVSNPHRNSDITGVNSAHGACSAAQGVFTVYSEFALRSPGDTRSTTGHPGICSSHGIRIRSGGPRSSTGPLGFHSGLDVARHRTAHGSPAVKKDQPTRFMAYAHFRPLQL